MLIRDTVYILQSITNGRNLSMYIAIGLILLTNKQFLNQARTGLWPAHAWFLRIALSANVGMRVCVCVSAPEAINN